jgi:hypothetical protein
LVYALFYDTITLCTNDAGKSILMAEKKLTDLKEFIENVNKKNKDHNGKQIKFAFVKRKRKAS